MTKKIRRHISTNNKVEAKSPISPWMIVTVIIIAFLSVGGLVALGYINSQPAIDLSQFPSLGDSNALVTVVEYSDYECSHCRDFNLEALPQLKADYIDSGKIKYIVYPFNLWPETAIATEAAWCAADQGKFFEYKHALYEKQGQIDLAEGPLTDLAANLELNQNAFAQCLSNGTHQAQLKDTQRAAFNRGINSTPTFFINNQKLNGFKSYEDFKQIIEQELAKAQ